LTGAILIRKVFLLRALPAVLVIAVAVFATVLLSAPSEATGTPVDYSAEEIRLVELLNEYRAGHGLNPLLITDSITRACDRHSSDMAEYRFVDHFTAGSSWFETGAAPWDRMAATGYSYKVLTGENLAAGYQSAAAVMEGWKDSPTHNAVMLDPDFNVIGVALVHVEESPYGYYWTADFGSYVDSTAHAFE
jgi:uncharacterized protein YkwD